MFSASGIESREGCVLWREPSEAALRPHETLHRSGQHEEIGLTIRRVILNDLVRRDPDPRVFQPGVPGILGILPAGILDPEFRLHRIARTTAGERFGVRPSIGMLVVIGPLQAFKPLLVRPVPCASAIVQNTSEIAATSSVDQILCLKTLRMAASNPWR
jgi:hypothetical protein